MSLGVNRPLSSSFCGVALAPSPCKPLCWRILLKTCGTQEVTLPQPVGPTARTSVPQPRMGDLKTALDSGIYASALGTPAERVTFSESRVRVETIQQRSWRYSLYRIMVRIKRRSVCKAPGSCTCYLIGEAGQVYGNI